jgi:hypothetical protein
LMWMLSGTLGVTCWILNVMMLVNLDQCDDVEVAMSFTMDTTSSRAQAQQPACRRSRNPGDSGHWLKQSPAEFWVKNLEEQAQHQRPNRPCLGQCPPVHDSSGRCLPTVLLLLLLLLLLTRYMHTPTGDTSLCMHACMCVCTLLLPHRRPHAFPHKLVCPAGPYAKLHSPFWLIYLCIHLQRQAPRVSSAVRCNYMH